MYQPNPIKDLVNNFNEYGILPNQKKMKEALVGSGVQSLSAEQLEKNLISVAIKDEEHPYHKVMLKLGLIKKKKSKKV